MLLQRLWITGFVQLLDGVHDVSRILLALVVMQLYLMVLLVFRPYKSVHVGLFATLAQTTLIFAFLGALCIQQHAMFTREMERELNDEVMLTPIFTLDQLQIVVPVLIGGLTAVYLAIILWTIW